MRHMLHTVAGFDRGESAMTLRTLIGRARDRDWMGVLVEIVIVVVGVFLGLQASNWNQDRQDSARGREYLARIDADLQGEIVLLRDTLEFSRSVGAYGDGAIAYAEAGTLYKDSAWQTLLAYYQASQVWPFRQPSTTFQEIRGSGELQLIRNAALRARIAAHYGDNAGSHAMEVLGLLPKYREDVRGMTPWPIQRYIWAHCYRSDENKLQQLVDCASPVSADEATAIITQYRQDAALTAELRFWLATVNTAQFMLASIQTDAEGVDRDVKAELDRR
jgi:hypothetical protein